MSTARAAAIAVAAELATRLPTRDVEVLSDHARRGPAALQSLAATTSAAVLRGACNQLTDLLVDGAIGADELSGALAGAAVAATSTRADLSVDVVWTGPESSVTTTRLTSAVIVELIDQARESLLLVSYATHDQPEVVAALHKAVRRGVHVVLLLERAADNAQFTQPGSPFADVRALRLSWRWPARQQGASLHAKALVVDRSTAFVGSANITGYALVRNLECGLLVRGGDVARRIWDHVMSLSEAGVLSREG